MPVVTRLLALMVALLATLPGGCGRKAAPGSATVRGSVTFQGQPLAGGLIVFTPDPDRGGTGKPIRGELGPDGIYELKVADDPAIPPGWYRIAIAATPVSASDSPGRLPFPAKLARPDTSGVLREVKAGQENVFDFAVEATRD